MILTAYGFGLWLCWIACGAAPDVSPSTNPGVQQDPLALRFASQDGEQHFGRAA